MTWFADLGCYKYRHPVLPACKTPERPQTEPGGCPELVLASADPVLSVQYLWCCYPCLQGACVHRCCTVQTLSSSSSQPDQGMHEVLHLR